MATTINSESRAAILAQLAGLASQQQVEKQIAALKARLAADPKDASSRKEIVRLYLVEMDNPAEAAKFLDETLDEPMRKYVPAAAKPVEDAPEAACTQLGDWYMGLADQAATPASKGAMLGRAQAYYQRFLALHTATDLGRTAATLTLKKIEDALAKLGPASEPKSNKEGFVPIFNGKDLTGWTGLLDGYKVENGVLVSLKEPSGNICTEKNYADFVLRLEFKLTPGANNGVGIRTPDGKQGSVYGGMEIQILDDSDPQYKTSKPYQFCGGIYNCVAPQRGHLKPVGQWNACEITANGRRVTVKLNGATVVDADLDKVAAAGTPDGKDHPGLKNKTGRIALLGYKSVVQFRNLRIKELKSDGAGK